MEKLSRIKSIDNFRFFRAYKWNNRLKPFNRFNLIYGWNGCGKSTLCDFFHSIEIDAGLPDRCAFQLCFQSDGQQERIVSEKTIQTVSHRFKVFHQGYVQGIISHPDNVKHISIIGHDAGKAVTKLDELKRTKTALESNRNSLSNAIDTATKEFEDYRRERASLVRSVTNYNQSYNYNKIYERYKQVEKTVELTENEYEKLVVSVRTTQKSCISIPSITYLNQEFCDSVLAVLSESPVYKAIERLQENSELRNWVHLGYEIHKHSKTKMCEFCHNPISPDRWSDLESHFNDSLKRFKQHVDAIISQLTDLKKQYEEFPAQLPHTTQFFDEFSTEYEGLRTRAIELCDVYTRFIDDVIVLVQRKNDKIIDVQCASEFITLLDTIDFDYSAIEAIKDLIKQHNKKSDDFSKCIAQDKERLELHIIAQSADKFIGYENQLSDNNRKRNDIKGKISAIEAEIRELDSQIKDSRIPAETINADIGFIFGHSDLYFKWKENGYEIRRNNEIATYLSTGEQNAIALIYFFNSLQDTDNLVDNCIVFLDDPVSSFDSNYYYSAAAYIRDKLQGVGQSFIFTHKFSLYKDFSRMFSGCHRYLLERENNMPSIKEEDPFLRDYQDEYIYLFHKVYHFTKNPPRNLSDYLPYPNMGRRLIEGFTSFKVPGTKDILAKAIELDGNGNTARVRAITRLMQNQSHIRLLGAHERANNILDIKQLPDLFQHLLDFIKEHDAVHYETLVMLVDPESMERPLENLDLPDAKERTIPLFDMRVSAGFGNRLESDEHSEPYSTSNPNADFALIISGDSMEPQFLSGDIVLVKKQKTFENAQIGIVTIDDEAFCKKIVITEDMPMLVSLNKKYPPLKVKEGERFEFLGIVIGKEKKDKQINT